MNIEMFNVKALFYSKLWKENDSFFNLKEPNPFKNFKRKPFCELFFPLKKPLIMNEDPELA